MCDTYDETRMQNIPNVTLYPLRTSRHIPKKEKFLTKINGFFHWDIYLNVRPSEIREVKQLPLTLLLFFTVHLKSTRPPRKSGSKNTPKNETGVWEKRWWTELLTSTIRIWQAFLQIPGSNKVHTLWKMDHPKSPLLILYRHFFSVVLSNNSRLTSSGKDLLRI